MTRLLLYGNCVNGKEGDGAEVGGVREIDKEEGDKDEGGNEEGGKDRDRAEESGDGGVVKWE